MKTPYTYQFFDKNTSINADVFGRRRAARVKQIHSAHCVLIDRAFRDGEWVEADAIVTTKPDVPIGVITADCVPILLYGRRDGEPVIAAAHAGWQGALKGILENTLRLMACPSSNIVAHIGPCIAQASYEVSEGFEIPFVKHNAGAWAFFKSGREGKLQFDLAGYCAFRLRAAGVLNITFSHTDTMTDDIYYSHRAGAKPGERNLSAIMING